MLHHERVEEEEKVIVVGHHGWAPEHIRQSSQCRPLLYDDEECTRGEHVISG